MEDSTHVWNHRWYQFSYAKKNKLFNLIYSYIIGLCKQFIRWLILRLLKCLKIYIIIVLIKVWELDWYKIRNSKVFLINIFSLISNYYYKLRHT